MAKSCLTQYEHSMKEGVSLAQCLGNRKVNPNWDGHLTAEQRELLAKPGFGITEQLPYLPESDVKEIMNIIESCVKHVKLIIETPKS